MEREQEKPKPQIVQIDEDEFNTEVMECKDATMILFTSGLITLEEATARMAKLNSMDDLIEEAKGKGVGIKYYKYDDGRIGYRFYRKKKMGFVCKGGEP